MNCIYPSILSIDFSCLGDNIRKIESSGLEALHVDVMDGHFVPNLTIGPSIVKTLRSVTPAFLDIHLMLQYPQKYIKAFAEAGADSLTVHVESDHDLQETIALIREHGKKVGIALNPETSPEILRPHLKDIDMVLVMSVHPGFGGQAFIKNSLKKIEMVCTWLSEDGLQDSVNVQVDGGVDMKTLLLTKDAGANLFVVGNAIFGKENPVKAFEELKNIL
ncbi:ribulose-phosphate 3-epimerase [PVC group bacterium (ex Bugula neritina AB1)]|nr:ribulose-phosphate 3-epimerase [PVC group bacterium (ex Bugula neritina AB1)]